MMICMADRHIRELTTSERIELRGGNVVVRRADSFGRRNVTVNGVIVGWVAMDDTYTWNGYTPRQEGGPGELVEVGARMSDVVAEVVAGSFRRWI